MKLVVLGATGGTGIEIVRQSLKRGHTVTAFVRSPERLKQYQDVITIKQGNLLDSAELEKAIKGNDAIVSGFGPRLPIKKGDSDLLGRFANALTRAMPNAGVNRVVVESTAFLFKDSFFPPAYLVGKLFFSDLVDDAAKMEKIFRESVVDWTIVRPPRLTDSPYTGKYRVLEDHLPPFGFSISRADIADCLLNMAEHPSTIDKVLGACN